MTNYKKNDQMKNNRTKEQISYVYVEPVSLVGRAQVVRSRGHRFWPRLDQQRVPHVQLKAEILGLCGAEVESRVSGIYK